MIASKCIVSLQHMASTEDTSVTRVSLPPEQKQFISAEIYSGLNLTLLIPPCSFFLAQKKCNVLKKLFSGKNV